MSVRTFDRGESDGRSVKAEELALDEGKLRLELTYSQPHLRLLQSDQPMQRILSNTRATLALAASPASRRTLTRQTPLPLSPPPHAQVHPPPSSARLPEGPPQSQPRPPTAKPASTSLATVVLAVAAATVVGYGVGAGFAGDDVGSGASSSSSAYPPPFGSVDDYNRGIAELRAIFSKDGREDDVSTDPGDLEEHGISTSVPPSPTLPARAL